MKPAHPAAAQPPAPAPIHTSITGGMPGGQITLIAVAAAVVAAAVVAAAAAVLLDRGRTALSGRGAGMAAPKTGTGGWHALVRRWPGG
jgi:hypothetical protein